MEKLVFKNMYMNVVLGGLLVIGSILGYFLNWFEDYLPYIVGAILVLLSTKRFWYSFKKTISKNATLILVIEFVLDLVFAGLLIYLQDHISLFIGLIIYVRGVAYLLINYIATRKIRLVQYLFNIGYVTLGAFLIFTSMDTDTLLILFVAILMLLIGAVYLQSGITELVRKEEREEELFKELKKEHKKELEEHSKVAKQQDKIEQLETKVKEVKEQQKKQEQENKELKKELDKAKPEPQPKSALEEKTVAELKTMAKEKNLTGYSTLTKAELIALLQGKK